MYELTLSGPAKNALGMEMFAFILDGLQAAAGRPVLLTGAGDAFCSGLNLREVADLDDRAMVTFLRRLEDVMVALYTYPAPTVALVNGHAVAGGCVLALCCDYRVAVPDPRARIGLNEVAIGLTFPPRIMTIVRRRVPTLYREQVMLGAALHDPDAALRLGLLDEVSARAPDRAREMLDALAHHPAAAYAATKAELRGTTIAYSPADEQRFLHEVVPVWTSDTIRSRILAVIKR